MRNATNIFTPTLPNVALKITIGFQCRIKECAFRNVYSISQKRIHILDTNGYIRVGTHHYVACTVTAYTGLIILFSYIHFPMPSSLVMSLVRLNCKVLCHGNWVRVTGSFLRRSCIAIRFICIRGL